MKNKRTKIVGATLVTLGLVAVPAITAHADSGIATNTITLKDQEGNIVKQYEANDTFTINGETEKTYETQINGNFYYVDKSLVLKTLKHTEESLSIISEQTTLKETGDYFGNVILQLDKDDKVTRLSATQNGFVKVKTAQNLEGWVVASALKQNLRSEPVTTTAYIKDDTLRKSGLSYGTQIMITGFENNKYKIKYKSMGVNKASVSFTKPAKRVITYLYVSPVRSKNISSLPGHRTDPVYGGSAYHAGTDIAVPKNTPVYATANGTVSTTHSGESENNGAGLGNYVKIQHSNAIESTYGHLTTLVVRNGQSVKQGDLIGYVGTTGKSTGYHLHFEVRQNGVVMDSSLIVKGNLNNLIVAP